ncbi:MAG: hypothetical protein KGN02_00535 [bacterium]|nr:hypothetical protein [bacterium]
MTQRAFAITLKIPDNAAYTALTTLQRLGLALARVERSEIWVVEDAGDASDFAARMERNETIFNPNKHRLTVIDGVAPRAGEMWIEELGAPRAALGRRYVGWRLLDANGSPASDEMLRDAAERLLCNPAIEKAHRA